MDDSWQQDYADSPITAAEPVWDGKGTDPWLVSRMEAAAEAATAELAIREAIWVELSKWIVSVSRAVMHTVMPDPTAIFAKSPEWAAAVNKIVRGPINDAVGIAYKNLLGSGYAFDSRPAIIEHLSTVSNRMVRTVDTTFDLVAKQVATGANLGESAAEIASRVDNVLSTTATERWPNRATVIARTETMSAINAGRQDSFAAVEEELDMPFEQMWITTIDNRTRPTHKRADGQRVPTGQPFIVGGSSLRFPGDPLGPGKEIIQCRCTMILLEPGETVDLTNRQFKNYK